MGSGHTRGKHIVEAGFFNTFLCPEAQVEEVTLVVGAGEPNVMRENDTSNGVLIPMDSINAQKEPNLVLLIILGRHLHPELFEPVGQQFPVFRSRIQIYLLVVIFIQVAAELGQVAIRAGR